MADKTETVKARVLRDFWRDDTQEGRVRAGSIIDVSKDDLIDGMEKGLLERAK